MLCFPETVVPYVPWPCSWLLKESLSLQIKEKFSSIDVVKDKVDFDFRLEAVVEMYKEGIIDTPQ